MKLACKIKDLCRMGLFVAFVCSTALMSVPTQSAQPQCGPEQAVLSALARDFGESQIASFLDRRGTLMRLMINMETRSWTLVALGPHGQACLVGFGDAFEPEHRALTPSQGS